MASLSSEFRLAVRQAGPILLDAELSCPGGQMLALVGPSGSGKSTLLRLIAGLSRPAHGRIECGQVWFDARAGICLTPQQRRVGYVPQHYGLFPHMTALGNVVAGLSELPVQARELRARSWLAKVHLEGLEQRRPAELSGGQQQRVALARALAREPAILLLDEPFSAVDRATREILYLELAELKRELALPIVMVTHDLHEALLLADRMTLLSHGRTLQSGTPREVMARPVDEAAARLVGIRNLFDGIVLQHDLQSGVTWIKAGSLRLACLLDMRWPQGGRVRWLVHNSGVRLPSQSGAELQASRNRVPMTVQALLAFGDEARVTALLAGLDDALHLQVPLALAEGLHLQTGATLDVVLREERLLLLPAR